MNCEIAHERIVTAAYGELGDEQTHELERHITGCPDCAAEREQMLALKALAEAHPVEEPSANLVARARLRLDEALDALPPRRWYERLGQRMRNNVAGLQAAPVAACLLLLIGAGAGSLGSYQFARNRAAHTTVTAAASAPALKPQRSAQAAAAGAPAEIANISSIVRQPNSHLVEVDYNQLVPQEDRGLSGRSGDTAVADAGQPEFDFGRRCGATRWGCWRMSARPGTVARRRAFALR